MLLYTAGIQLLPRIYNALFINGEKSKSEPFKETNSLNIRIYFLEISS